MWPVFLKHFAGDFLRHVATNFDAVTSVCRDFCVAVCVDRLFCVAKTTDWPAARFQKRAEGRASCGLGLRTGCQAEIKRADRDSGERGAYAERAPALPIQSSDLEFDPTTKVVFRLKDPPVVHKDRPEHRILFDFSLTGLLNQYAWHGEPTDRVPSLRSLHHQCSSSKL